MRSGDDGVRAFLVRLPSGRGTGRCWMRTWRSSARRMRSAAGAVRPGRRGVDDQGVCGRDRAVLALVRPDGPGVAGGGRAARAVHHVAVHAGPAGPASMRGPGAAVLAARAARRRGRRGGSTGADGGAGHGGARGGGGTAPGIWCRCCMRSLMTGTCPTRRAGDDGADGVADAGPAPAARAGDGRWTGRVMRISSRCCGGAGRRGTG